MWLLCKFLDKFVIEGALAVISPDGKSYRFGPAAAGKPQVVVRLKDKKTARKIAMHPELALGEAYMDGELITEEGDIRDLLDICCKNLALWKKRKGHKPHWLVKLAQLFTQFNSPTRSRKNVAHHYDLSHDLYATFLDKSWQYSCAYFPHPEATLEEAQEAKMLHIAAKLCLEPGHKVLDIGCGWGRLDMALAKYERVHVSGVTLSTEQLADAKAAAKREGLDKATNFSLTDYRSIQDRFDRIVSVGMFEHVGAPFYDAFFEKSAELMKDEGVMVLHTIGDMAGAGVGNPWISKYIFPGGYIPSLSEIVTSVEKAGLIITDVEVLRLHYAETLNHWRKRFLAHWDQIKDKYDERFRRMWEFYLAGSEMAFRHMGLVVFQVQITKDQTAVPLTRDYITAFEQSRIANAA